MSADRTRVRALLAAGLDDAASIETRPIDEIRAELARMGVDPTASIRLAQSVAGDRSKADSRSKTGSPAASLLEKIARSEAVDAEIAALETADIDEVRASLPAGITASATAAAERRSGRSSKVVGLKKRRGSVLGWGGSLAGIAACILLFIAIRPDRLDEVTVPLSSIGGRSSDTTAAERADVEMEAGGAGLEERARALATPAPAPVVQQDQPAASSGNAPSLVVELDDVAPADAHAEESELASLADRREQALSMERPLDRARAAAAPAAKLSPSAPITPFVPSKPAAPSEPAAVVVPAVPVDLSWLPDTVTAVVLADRARAPIELEPLADALPDQRLAARLDDARNHAAGRTIVALIAFVRDGERVEAALVEKPAPAVAGASAFAENEAVLPKARPSFELLELPSTR